MSKKLQTTRTLLSVLIGAIGAPQLANAQPVTAPLVQFPAGTAYRQPAPNVIITLDDSGSMGYYEGGGTTQNETRLTSRMAQLKAALREVFRVENVPDGAIRLAWNTLNNCRSIPSATGGCFNLNRMRVLDSTHRNNFLNWVGNPGDATNTLLRLSASGSTPTHHAFIAAGEYLRNGSATAIESPWAKVPGATAAPVLTCRRSYNVLMTDGGWNFSFASHGTGVSRPAGTTNPNTDTENATLPDGTAYDVTSAQTRLYRDNPKLSYRFTYGGQWVYVSTLADLAFYYWATDLALGLANDLKPLTSKVQTIGTGATAVTPEPYWNPRNNPATWQHMTTYTIGFGDAARWKTVGSYSGFPVWDTAANDNFGGDLDKLFSGTKSWPDPINGTLSLEESNNNGDAASTNEEARKVELWHMAINSRGKFVATTDGPSLVQAFKDIFSQIAADNSNPVTNFANASSSINRSDVAQYVAGYEADGWRGYVRADTLAQGTGAATPYAGWGTTNRTTADKLDALNAAGIANRLILTFSDKATGGGPKSFEWAGDETYLSTAQKDAIKESTSTSGASNELGQRRLNYIRGDRSLEIPATSGIFRQRSSRQGDIVNSALWYIAQPVSGYGLPGYLAFAQKHKARLPMVYVGGNDGMLHGFSGTDGSERIAYVPKGVISNLALLTKPDYDHRYFVDGSPYSGDVFVPPSTGGPAEWRTQLIGTLGAGGKGYFVLDVTTPGSTATDSTAVSSNFLKANAAQLVVMDKTSAIGSTTEDADIGHIMAGPVLEDSNPQKTTQITRMNDGRWAVVMGNGVNSTNQRPVLLIQYLDGARELLKISAATTGANATANGLSAPRLVDINDDGTPDVVYAGDLKGNLWKFNVASATSSEWKPAFGTALSGWLPLYTATHTSTAGTITPQPITAPPLVRPNKRGAGGLMVAFGTGRNLTEADRSSTAVQSIYSVLDTTRYRLVSGKVVLEDAAAAATARVGTGVTDLVQQTIVAQVAGTGSSNERTFWTVSQNDVPYTGDGAKKGWYMNLPASGERLLAQMRFFDESNNIELITEVPASGGSTSADESCAPLPSDQKTYRTFLNINDGKRPSWQVLDQNGDGAFNSSDQNVSRMTASSKEGRVSTTTKIIVTGADGKKDELRLGALLPLRPNWRQLQ